MSVGSGVSGEIILLKENIKEDMALFKEAVQDFFGSIVEYHTGIWDIELGINGKKIFQISPCEKSEEEVTNIINEKVLSFLNSEEKILEELEKILDNKIDIYVNYNLMGMPFITIMKALYEKYNVFEFKAFQDTDHEYFTIYKFEDNEIESYYSEDTDYMENGYIEDLEVFGKYIKLGFFNKDEKVGFDNKIDQAKKLIEALNIKDLSCDKEELSSRETELELYCVCLNKENKKNFIDTIKGIVEMFDYESGEFYCYLNFGSATHCYLETYFLEGDELEVRHIN